MMGLWLQYLEWPLGNNCPAAIYQTAVQLWWYNIIIRVCATLSRLYSQANTDLHCKSVAAFYSLVVGQRWSSAIMCFFGNQRSKDGVCACAVCNHHTFGELGGLYPLSPAVRCLSQAWHLDQTPGGGAEGEQEPPLCARISVCWCAVYVSLCVCVLFSFLSIRLRGCLL